MKPELVNAALASFTSGRGREIALRPSREVAPREADQPLLDALHAQLAPAAPEVVGEIIARLLVTARRERDDVSEQVLQEEYFEALSDFSERALRQAHRDWLRGEPIEGEKVNSAFPPSPRQFAMLARKHEASTRAGIARIMARPRLFVAPIVDDATAERVGERMAALSERMGKGPSRLTAPSSRDPATLSVAEVEAMEALLARPAPAPSDEACALLGIQTASMDALLRDDPEQEADAA